MILHCDTSLIAPILFLLGPNADHWTPPPPAEQMQKTGRRLTYTGGALSGNATKDQKPADRSMGQLISNTTAQSDPQEGQDSGIVSVQATGTHVVQLFIKKAVL